MAKGGFRGGYGGGGYGGMNMNMLKQAQKMQQDMLKAQQEVEAKEFSATAGGGMVKATVSGKCELLSLEIEQDAIVPEDAEMLSDTIVAAVNQALRQAQTAMSDVMSKATGGMNLGF